MSAYEEKGTKKKKGRLFMFPGKRPVTIEAVTREEAEKKYNKIISNEDK